MFGLIVHIGLIVILYVDAFSEIKELWYSPGIPPTPQTPTKINIVRPSGNKTDNGVNNKGNYHKIRISRNLSFF
jgi:hypothetical protein